MSERDTTRGRRRRRRRKKKKEKKKEHGITRIERFLTKRKQGAREGTLSSPVKPPRPTPRPAVDLR